MPVLYAFYPCMPDGVAVSLEVMELASDDEAVARAARVLADHESAAYVMVWQSSRQVATAHRDS